MRIRLDEAAFTNAATELRVMALSRNGREVEIDRRRLR
jgi:hypothetical protein